MMHITEDTPPDMLAGAMDLTVQLPNSRLVKMSVERSTPMMDVLVQITTAHHLQLSGYVIEAMGMTSTSEHSDKVLPYKPNTPIGTLDTRHVRVVPKTRTLPTHRNPAPPGYQPFESTFRLKVHLPRKQLFVSRVSMNVLLEDVMRKVCDEKNLDPVKYEFRHPDNLDEVLDPKLTLSDYQITEIYVVSKGSSRLSQAFSASDIMALRKDEERTKQGKSSGGVFNLIFKRGKTSNGSGSVSSENRSISPTHSDDSRSLTPPAVQQQIIKEEPKPKVPLRKRRPAPKPPQIKEEPSKKTEAGLTICHSRNSSDSSGYHEASVLSDNVNTTLPRRPQTMVDGPLSGEHSRSTGNLASMSPHSKSTSSLAFTGRKKKAPPPPPVPRPSSNVEASPVVASPVEKQDLPAAPARMAPPIPKPRTKVVLRRLDDDRLDRRSLDFSTVMRDSSALRVARRGIKSMDGLSEDILESSSSKDLSNTKSVADIAVGGMIESSSSMDSKVDGNGKSLDDIADRLVPPFSDDTRETMCKPGASNQRSSGLQTDTGSEVRRKSKATDVSTLVNNENSGTLETTEDARLFKLSTREQSDDTRLSTSSSKRNSTATDAVAGILETRTDGESALADEAYPRPQESSFPAQSENYKGEFQSSTIEDNQTEDTRTDSRNSKDAICSIPKSGHPVNASEDRSFKPVDGAKETSIEDARVARSTVNGSRSKLEADDIGEKLENLKGYSADEEKLVATSTEHVQDSGSNPDDAGKRLESNKLAGTSKSVIPMEEAGGEIRVASTKDNSKSTESEAKKTSESSSTIVASTGRCSKSLNQIDGAGDKIEVASSDSRSKVNAGRLLETIFSENTRVEGNDDSSNVVEVISTLDDVLDQYDYPEYENITKAPSTKNDSYSKALENIHLDLFTRKSKKISVPLFPRSASGEDDMSDIDIELFENPRVAGLDKDMSTSSLRSVDSIPGWHSFNLSKWRNLDDISAVSGLHGRWVIGDTDAESVNQSEPQIQEPQYTTNSPPESIASSLATTLSSNIETDINLSKESSEIVENEPVQEPAPERSFSPIRDEAKELETEWEYRLPSPPTAFRDSSPTTVVETEKFKGDSVVTSPELFEKLQLVQEAQSDITASVVSEDEKSIYNKLSLEHLEKRKSLVYNRELATSLKCKDEDSVESLSSKRSSIMSELEEVINKSSTLSRRQDNFVHAPVDSALPNFKITTYDMPKKKINIFEDDSIRSNAEVKVKPEPEKSFKEERRPIDRLNSIASKDEVKNSLFKEDSKRPSFNNRSNSISSKDEVIFRKASIDEGFKRPEINDRSNSIASKDEVVFRKAGDDDGFKRPEVNRYRARTLARVENGGVGRSESFSSNGWVPMNPVKRSKSQVALNQYKEVDEGESNGMLSKSNSLFDVSGLQSLEVIRSIQTKLNTPRNSTEQLDRKEDEVQKDLKQPEPVQLRQKTYQYRGPPSINLGTWSERPKSQISLKEDTDYKFGRSKIPETTNVSVNGSQHISTQSSGNVVIKIGGGDNFTRRKPLGNVNKVETRPHSMAYDRQHFDISRVPIVRSVELKKPFKDMHISNTSITQICHAEPKSLNLNGFYGSNETLNKRTFPVVKGFKDYATNKNVPFSQCNLRRTDSNKTDSNKAENLRRADSNKAEILRRADSNKVENLRNAGPPPPPLMAAPKTPRRLETSTDPRGQLLDAIRNFGGKKGLRTTKA